MRDATLGSDTISCPFAALGLPEKTAASHMFGIAQLYGDWKIDTLEKTITWCILHRAMRMTDPDRRHVQKWRQVREKQGKQTKESGVIGRNKRRRDESVADLKELMTAAPTSVEIHAAVMRKRVRARRLVEDALEAAKQKRSDFSGQ